MPYLAPSLLSADMARLAEAIEMLSPYADYMHCDVMDGHFVPNLTFGAPVVRAIKKVTKIPLDVHLMIENPGRWIRDYIKAGLDRNDYLTIHLEAEDEPKEILKQIRLSGVRSGISVKPKTNIERVMPLLPYVDQVLVMTVEPGFGGQSFMREMMDKIRYLSALSDRKFIIGVDGGIDINTASEAVDSGADLFVAGSAIYGNENPVKAAKDLKNIINRTYG